MDLPSEFVLEEKNIRLDKWWEHYEVMNDTGSSSNHASATTAILPQIHQQFITTLQKYQPLFNELDDLDANLWILEPFLDFSHIPHI